MTKIKEHLMLKTTVCTQITFRNPFFRYERKRLYVRAPCVFVHMCTCVYVCVCAGIYSHAHTYV